MKNYQTYFLNHHFGKAQIEILPSPYTNGKIVKTTKVLEFYEAIKKLAYLGLGGFKELQLDLEKDMKEFLVRFPSAKIE